MKKEAVVARIQTYIRLCKELEKEADYDYGNAFHAGQVNILSLLLKEIENSFDD